MDELEICRIVASTLNTNLESIGVSLGSNLVLIHIRDTVEVAAPDFHTIEINLVNEAATRGSQLGLVRFL